MALPPQRGYAMGFSIILIISALLFFPAPASSQVVFWSEPDGQIYSNDLEGGPTQLLVDQEGSIQGLAIDPIGEKMYWTNYWSSPLTPHSSPAATLIGLRMRTTMALLIPWSSMLV